MKARIYYLSQLRPDKDVKSDVMGKERRIKDGLSEWILFRQYWQDKDSPTTLAERMDITGEELAEFISDRFNERYLSLRKRLRIEDAGEILLENPGLPVYMAGRMVGINDKSDFRKIFVSEKGCTPSEWKRHNGRRGRIRVNALLDKARNHFRSLRKP